MTQASKVNVEPPVENPEALNCIARSNKRRLAQPKMVVERLALETYIEQ